MQKGMKAASPTYFELTNVNFLYVEMLHTGNYCTADYFSCIMSRLFELSMSYSDLSQMKSRALSANRTCSLIVRLHHSVNHTGLRNINISY